MEKIAYRRWTKWEENVVLSKPKGVSWKQIGERLNRPGLSCQKRFSYLKINKAGQQRNKTLPEMLQDHAELFVQNGMHGLSRIAALMAEIAGNTCKTKLNFLTIRTLQDEG